MKNEKDYRFMARNAFARPTMWYGSLVIPCTVL